MTGAGPSPEHARLATALRELKKRTGLSLAGLADRTPYSKSSWDRYLNGKALPPRQAVRALCGLAGEQDGRCLALWELAESRGSGRAAVVAGTVTPPPPPAGGTPPRGRAGRRTVVTLLAAVGAVTVGGLAAALLLLGGDDGRQPSPPGHRCRGAACEGKNPMHMICALGPPATLASYRTATGARVELRYSADCGAGWARTWGTSTGDRIEVTASGGPPRSAEVMDETDAGSYVYTAMVAVRPGAVLRACFRPGAGDGKECFTGRAPRPGQLPRSASWS
ncbi:DUF2690 domain-containing protein [Streptomyces sp. NPDC002793]|uniref:helix-turn-helix domain-containing protein n=1 Tax=Streptomyces sp. NPDC002793 TaxID=3154432 RepID=UPI0033180FCF